MESGLGCRSPKLTTIFDTGSDPVVTSKLRLEITEMDVAFNTASYEELFKSYVCNEEKNLYLISVVYIVSYTQN